MTPATQGMVIVRASTLYTVAHQTREIKPIDYGWLTFKFKPTLLRKLVFVGIALSILSKVN